MWEKLITSTDNALHSCPPQANNGRKLETVARRGGAGTYEVIMHSLKARFLFCRWAYPPCTASHPAPPRPSQVEVEKPLGLTLEGRKPYGVKVKSAKGNAALAGIKPGDTVIYTSSFFGMHPQSDLRRRRRPRSDGPEMGFAHLTHVRSHVLISV